ncbi:hypothetical protein [Paraburkholderia dipogonis]|uniref:hypothetical protein n=1 Tax=Paraburkholderia dipogonis TaxID=1211383 RepID=UPI0038BB6014
MTPQPIEAHRGFNILLGINETPTEWICDVAFERADGDVSKPLPAGYSKTVLKVDAGAMNFGGAVIDGAKSLIDDWYERGNG